MGDVKADHIPYVKINAAFRSFHKRVLIHHARKFPGVGCRNWCGADRMEKPGWNWQSGIKGRVSLAECNDG
jgi:hypothetical protein